MTLLIKLSQVIADFTHAAAEEFAVDILGKLIQVATVIKEFPVLGLGFSAQHMALILLYPLVHLGRFSLLAQRQQELVHSHPDGIVFLQLDVVIEVTVQFTGEIAKDGLEERVDGTHVEVTVVKQQLVQCQTCQ